jgi:crossover junction endodeoxyribonuclease RuvC
MLTVGIDPGITGALALMDGAVVLSVVDMPTVASSKGKNQVNAAELANILTGWWSKYGGFETCLELVHTMPGQGVSSSGNFMMGFGIIQGVVAALRISVIMVTPNSWKKRAGLIGKDKDFARTFAQRLYPSVELGRKKDIGRADAILIALYGKGNRP